MNLSLSTGCKYISDDRKRFRQIFWIVTLCLAFGGVSYHCYNLISSYRKYSTMEAISNMEKENVFPSVTFCNHDPISKLNMEEAMTMSNSFNAQVNAYFKRRLPRNKELFSSVSREFSKRIGHKFRDMILFCKFGKDS